MHRKLSILALVLVLMVSFASVIGVSKNLEESLDVNACKLETPAGRPLLPCGAKDAELHFITSKEIPERPENPEDLPKTEALHWWDQEFSGWGVEKTNIPKSPEDGAIGKDVILLKAGNHPYWTAYVEGAKKVAKAYDMDFQVMNSNWNIDLQSRQTRQAINQHPDLIIFAPVDVKASTRLIRQINRAGIPVIGTNTLVTSEAHKYLLAWTGPDDWGQFRLLSRVFADKMNKEGGYAIVRHMPGSSPYFARTWAPITELEDYAPEMERLAMDTSNLKAQPTYQLVSSWLSKYGEELEGIVSAGDGPTITGIRKALNEANREDIVVVAAGNSKKGMQAIQDGILYAESYQSAMGDGALAVKTAADYFNGKDVPPVRYLPKHIITAEDVEKFLPAQW